MHKGHFPLVCPLENICCNIFEETFSGGGGGLAVVINHSLVDNDWTPCCPCETMAPGGVDEGTTKQKALMQKDLSERHAYFQ